MYTQNYSPKITDMNNANTLDRLNKVDLENFIRNFSSFVLICIIA